MGSPACSSYYQCVREWLPFSQSSQGFDHTDKDFLCCPPNYYRQIEAWGRSSSSKLEQFRDECQRWETGLEPIRATVPTLEEPIHRQFLTCLEKYIGLNNVWLFLWWILMLAHSIAAHETNDFIYPFPRLMQLAISEVATSSHTAKPL